MMVERKTEQEIIDQELGCFTLDKVWLSEERVKKAIEECREEVANADRILCGCGCNRYLEMCHGLYERALKDVEKKLLGVGEE